MGVNKANNLIPGVNQALRANDVPSPSHKVAIGDDEQSSPELLHKQVVDSIIDYINKPDINKQLERFFATCFLSLSMQRQYNLKDLKEQLDDLIFNSNELLPANVEERGIAGIEALMLAQIRGYKNIFNCIDRLENIDDSSKGVNFSPECLRDVVRTRKFLQSISHVVNDLASKKFGKINLVDAGCGSIPIMGVYAALCSDRVHATLIENDPVSFIVASQLIYDLGLQDRVKVLKEDAEKFSLDKAPDLIISETMNAAFVDEKMPCILNNLKGSFNHDISFVPERVELTLFEGDKDASREIASWNYEPGEETLIRFMHNRDQGLGFIRTKVYLPGDICLEANESDITRDMKFELKQGALIYPAGYQPEELISK